MPVVDVFWTSQVAKSSTDPPHRYDAVQFGAYRSFAQKYAYCKEFGFLPKVVNTIAAETAKEIWLDEC